MSDEFSNEEMAALRRARRKRVLPTFLIFACVYFGIRGCVNLASRYFGDQPSQTPTQPQPTTTEDGPSGTE